MTVSFIYITYRYGKSYLTAFILSFYPTYFLFDVINDKFIESTDTMTVLWVFIACFALVLYILRASVHGGLAFSPGKQWLDAIALTVGAISQLAFVYYFALPEFSDIYNLSGVIDAFVNNTIPYILLTLAPFVALLVSAKD